MSQQRHVPPRARPDLGKPTRRSSKRAEARAVAGEESPESLVEGVTGVRAETGPLEEPEVVGPTQPLWARFLLAGGYAAVGGWVLTSVVVTLAWLMVPVGSFGSVLTVSTQAWLAGHGAGFYWDDTVWTLVPYGLTLLWVGLLTVLLRSLNPPDDLEISTLRWQPGMALLGYAAPLLIASAVTGPPVQLTRVVIAAPLVVSVSMVWAFWAHLPDRVRHLLGAVRTGVATMLLTGTLALITALLIRREEVAMVAQDLGGGVMGAALSVFVQLLYVPTAALWALSYVLGAGFSVGAETGVTPFAVESGVLPGWPLFAAVPAQTPDQPWALGWAAGGVLAGALAGTALINSRGAAGPLLAARTGALAGIATGVATTGLAILARGDLGVARLTGLGPFPLPMFLMSCGLTLLGGLLAGAVIGFGGNRADREEAAVPQDGAETYDENADTE